MPDISRILCTDILRKLDMEPKSHRISIIAALGKNTQAIGRDNDLIWKGLKEDLLRFKRLTSGHPVIMGRNTWLSLPEKFRPLPSRFNIVISSNIEFEASGAMVANSLDAALETARQAPGSEEIFIIGGGMVYEMALPFTDRLYLTLVDDDAEGDTFFPPYDEFSEVIEREKHPEHSPPFTFLRLERSGA